MIYIGIRSASNNSGEKDKMRTALRTLLEEFMSVENYDQILQACHKVNYLEESQVD